MSRFARLLVVLGLLAVTVTTALPPDGAFAQDAAAERIVDIADIPVPVDDLPEVGYQVMAGGYLDLPTAAGWIAEPRGRSVATLSEELVSSGWLNAYVMDLVLLEDRAYATSDILALVQTNIFVMPDASGAGRLYDVMTDYANADIENVESAILDSTTVRLVSQSGDTLRTVFTRDRMVVEVVSLERFEFVDLETHSNVVARTADRTERSLETGNPGLAPRAARLVDGEDLASFQDVQQSGVHHLYRLRDGRVQPAAGELNAPAAEEMAPGITQVYHGSAGIRLGGGTGTGFMSTWIGEFAGEADAVAFMGQVSQDGPSAWLADPYFAIAEGEQATAQGVAGLYRVTGLLDSQPYSGNLEIRQQGAYVVAVGFRTLGSALPPVDVTSRVMDHQLGCLESNDPCALLDVSELLRTTSATPVAPAGSTGQDLIVSDEFGWSVQTDAGGWTVMERFAESGYDFLELQSGRSLVTFESVINQHGDAQQCVIDELDNLQEFESSAVIELGSDVEGERSAGMEEGHAWAIYTVEPLADERADQEYTIRIDCYTLIEGGANLVVTHRAPRYEWGIERERGDEIRDTIVLPSSISRAPLAFVTMAGPGELRPAA